jgi:MinD-like ATPase involved in chromosome partitioning or flagellar assembly
MSSAPTSDEPLKSAPPRQGKIVTFYSYKGGTGRSMALANVAWILATNNQRVLLVDWDLEAPGLHRYLYPFLEDKQLTSSLGVINLVQEYQSTVIKDVTSTTGAQTLPAAWYEERADILRYTTELTFPFEGSGKIHFIPAGTQDASYATLVNRFNWQQLFDKLGGFHFFEAIKKQMRAEYDYVLIDSRTGVSDTSGLCTVQFPDDVVVCFTLNNQSTEGASAIASSIHAQRQPGDSPGPVQIWPLPTRIELAEKLKLDRARERARALFDPFLNNLTMRERDAYWGSVEVLYQPFFAYEEVLTAFADLPGQSHSMLSSLERLVSMFTRSSVTGMKLLAEKLRKDTLAAFSRRPGAEANRILSSLASQYEEIRRTMDAGDERTRAMTELVNRAQVSVDASESSGLAAQIFSDGSDGARIVGLALAQAFPESQHLTLALEAIQNRRSSFEQYNALVLAQSLADKLGSAERRQLAAAVQSQLGSTIDTSDLSRWNPSQDLLRKLTAADGSNNDALENRWLKFAPKPKPLEADEQWHVYISYRSANRPWVMSLYDALRQQGYQVFFDQVVLAPGTNLLH